jgi:hypothetical protein
MDNIIFYESADKRYVLQNGGLWWSGPGSFAINNITSTTFGQFPSIWPTILITGVPF